MLASSPPHPTRHLLAIANQPPTPQKSDNDVAAPPLQNHAPQPISPPHHLTNSQRSLPRFVPPTHRRSLSPTSSQLRLVPKIGGGPDHPSPQKHSSFTGPRTAHPKNKAQRNSVQAQPKICAFRDIRRESPLTTTTTWAYFLKRGPPRA